MDRVIFVDIEGQITAIFPELKADYNGNLTSYAHIGQHSACNPEHIFINRIPSYDEYKPLLYELIQIGYDPCVISEHERRQLLEYGRV